jgi:hypothetical protein
MGPFAQSCRVNNVQTNWVNLRWRLSGLALLLLLTCPSRSRAQQFEPDTNRFGMDIRDFDLPSNSQLCYNACRDEQRCRSFTFRKPNGWPGAGPSAHCWLKYGIPAAKVDKCCVSGIVRSESTHLPSRKAPSITSVHPNVGPASGGTRVTLRGAGFSGASKVTFGGNPATEFRVLSDGEVIAVAPAFPNPAVVPPSGYQVDAAVCTPAGCSPQYVPGNFTYRK